MQTFVCKGFDHGGHCSVLYDLIYKRPEVGLLLEEKRSGLNVLKEKKIREEKVGLKYLWALAP